MAWGLRIRRHCKGANVNVGWEVNGMDGGRVSFIKFSNQVFRMNILSWLPTIMCFGEPFPLDEVLELVPPSSDP
jgi:hypothetical protein